VAEAIGGYGTTSQPARTATHENLRKSLHISQKPAHQARLGGHTLRSAAMTLGRDALASRCIAAALALTESAGRTGFRGPDPFDALWWRWPAAMVGGRRRRQALIQLHARSPVDLRRLYRRRHPLIPKALGVFGSVGMRAHRLTGAVAPRELGLQAVQLLDADRGAGLRAWGYPWDMQTRWSFYPAASPNVVVSAFASSALLEAGDLTGRTDLVERAREAARWTLDDTWIEREGYFAYHAGRPVNIHNANLLGAWLVHVAAFDDGAARGRVRRAVERTLAAQRPDGSWPYGEADNLAWADSLHSGYVLICLDRLRAIDPRVDDAVARGAAHYGAFFDARGRARLWARKPFPEDAHSAGTGLSALAMLLRRGLVERELIERVAQRMLDVGLRGDHVVHRRYRVGRTTVRYLRWCDAHVALGLVDAAAALSGHPDLAPQGQRLTAL
jgi:hypothetical protein